MPACAPRQAAWSASDLLHPAPSRAPPPPPVKLALGIAFRPHPAERWRSVGRRCDDHRVLRRQAAAAAFGAARWASLDDLLLHAAAGLDGARALRLLHEEEWADELQVTRCCLRSS